MMKSSTAVSSVTTKKYPPVLIDSNVLIAFANENDSLHTQALALQNEIEINPKIINQYIYIEVLTILLQRTKNLSLVREVHQELSFSSSNFRVSTISKELFSASQNEFLSQSGFRLSFIDCSLIAQAKIENLNTIVTFDRQLRKAIEGKLNVLPKKLESFFI